MTNLKNLKIEPTDKYLKGEEFILSTLANKDVIRESELVSCISHELLTKIDLFLSNTNLSKKDQLRLLKLIVTVYDEGDNDQ